MLINILIDKSKDEIVSENAKAYITHTYIIRKWDNLQIKNKTT